MITTALGTPVLAVGDPSRRRIGLAAVMALWTAAGFVVYLWVAKEIRLLYVHEPWQNDPYDAVVSFAFFFVPILAAFCLTRAALCKSAKPLHGPARARVAHRQPPDACRRGRDIGGRVDELRSWG